MKLDPTSLRLYVAVVERGAISAAASSEHIAAAAVSKRISELEDVLSTQLLVRTHKGVEPTPAGVALLNLARRALHELDEVLVQMREYSSGIRGRVRVFSNISAITQFLPGEIRSFLVKHPQVQIHLEEKISTDIVKAVAENIADVGIFTVGSHSYNLETFPYHADRLALITPRDHALAGRRSLPFADALDFDFVGLHTGSAINLLLTKAASELRRSVRLRFQVTSYDALCLMVESGIGIGILPEAVARHYVKTLRIRCLRLTESWTSRELRICVRSYEALPAAARLFVDHIRRPIAKGG